MKDFISKTLFSFSVNINPYIVEECLISHQAVLECAVVSGPDPLGQVRNSCCSSKNDDNSLQSSSTSRIINVQFERDSLQEAF